ncbi:oxygenase MpaB family protein [Saccharopolyspora sp. CA-218241]|uniref:oxygenase MpaB family protein n=1 Tax=Saccharopolyspora sp. CA-218241 TaxID=3240027 RepID=UPI003D968ED5
MGESERFARLRRILALDADRDCEEIFRLLAEHEFPWDIGKALEFALFRTYAVPAVGRLLDRTGEFVRCPQRRYDDTTLLLYEIFHSGPSGARGREALARLNAIHGRYRISNADHLYTLSTFVVTPTRWLDRYGWRRLHPHEVRALTNTMRRMGEGMGITGIPEDHAGFVRLFDDYERDHFGFHPGGRRVAEATLALFASWYPRPLRPAVVRAARCAMEPHLLAAFGFPEPAPLGRALVDRALRTRAALVRLGPVRPDSRPAAPVPLSYPDGYRIGDLGPASSRRTRREGGRTGREHPDQCRAGPQ